MNEISKTILTKKGSKWIETYKTTDESEVYKDLAWSLLAKKFHKCTYITSIKEHTNYNGTRTATVYYDNGTKAVFVIADRI